MPPSVSTLLKSNQDWLAGASAPPANLGTPQTLEA